MKSLVHVLLVVVLFAGGTTCSALAVTDIHGVATEDHLRSLIEQANQRIDAKDNQGTADVLKQLVSDPDFSSLPSSDQHWAYRTLAIAAYQTKENATAARAARSACSYPQADADDWNVRYWVARRRNDKNTEVQSMTVIGQKWPTYLSRFTNDTIYDVYRTAKSLPSGAEREAKFLLTLYNDNWKPKDDVSEAEDYLWLDLIRYYLNQQDTTDAKVIGKTITNPDVIRRMREEKIFDSIVASDPQHFNIIAAYASALENAMSWVREHRNSLAAVGYEADLLEEIDEPKQELTLVDMTLERIKNKARPAYTDLSDELNWIYQDRADALLYSGRTEEGLAQYQKAAAQRENGGPNVSQTINLAEEYNVLGRPRDTLATLAKLNQGSGNPFGRMQYEEAKGCADVQLNKAVALAESLAYMDEHEKDAPFSYVQMLICVGDIDAAAKVVIEQLDNPNTMPDTLDSLQVYAQPKMQKRSAFAKELDSHWDQLRARADVKAAVKKVGRILHLPVVQF